MEIVNLKNIHTFQIEMTSFCNSFCGACLRNVNGGPVNPKLRVEHMSWNVWKKICDACIKYDVEKIIFNGNFGDVSNHPEFNQMLEYLYSKKNNISIDIHTNGGARTPTFWKELSKIIKKFPSSYVVFSIDGLEDTNHIYRRGVDFNKIMQNAESFIEGGSDALWRMIVFDHNIHQIEQASLLSKKMKFSAFFLNNSYSRNIKVDNYKKMPAGVITAPNTDNVNELKSKFEWQSTTLSKRKKLSRLKTPCPWQRDRKIQINQAGDVWPCCYFNMYIVKNDKINVKWLNDKLDIYDKNFNNLNFFNFDEILMHEFFQTDLLRNFENREFPYCISKCNI